MNKQDIGHIRELLKDGNRIRALRYIRRVSNCDLIVAKMVLGDIQSRRPWTFPKH